MCIMHACDLCQCPQMKVNTNHRISLIWLASSYNWFLLLLWYSPIVLIMFKQKRKFPAPVRQSLILTRWWQNQLNASLGCLMKNAVPRRPRLGLPSRIASTRRQPLQSWAAAVIPPEQANILTAVTLLAWKAASVLIWAGALLPIHYAPALPLVLSVTMGWSVPHSAHRPPRPTRGMFVGTHAIMAKMLAILLLCFDIILI